MNPYIQYMYSYPHKTAYRPLTGTRLADCADSLSGPGCGLYLHIPFCQTKCGYCNLFSVTGAKTDEMETYLDAVERQLGQYRGILEPAGTRFSDFTIGGGTPLLLTARQLERVFAMTESYLHFDENPSIVIETAPNQTDSEKLQLLKDRGVTRVSMGIQSFFDRELETLHRGHSGKKAQEALELLLSFGFDCVNADFIYGIPGQTIRSLLDSLEKAVSLCPQEIFLYPLYVKHGAGLERALRDGMVLEPEKAFEQYREAGSFLRSEGFRQDSMRRFVRRNSDASRQDSMTQLVRYQKNLCRQNGGIISDRSAGCSAFSNSDEHLRPFSECGFGTSLALGCGGRSYVGNLHFCTPYAITRQDCMRELHAYENTQDFTAVTHGIVLSREEQKRRYVIRHILIRPGLDIDRYREHFGTEVLEDFPLLAEWMEKGYLVLLSAPGQSADRSNPAQRGAGCDPARHDMNSCNPARHNTDSCNPARHDTDSCNPARHDTDSYNPARHDTDSYNPARYDTDSCNPARYDMDSCDSPQRKAESGWLVLTDDGLGLSDYLGPQLISREIGEKMAEWETAHGQTNRPLMQQLEKL